MAKKLSKEQIHLQAIQLAKQPCTVISFRDHATTSGYVYVALNPELDGCMAQGKTMQEAKDNLDKVRIDYMRHFLEQGLPIPSLTKRDE